MTDRERIIGDLKRIANEFHFTATRVGYPRCLVRRAAKENDQHIQDAIAMLRADGEK